MITEAPSSGEGYYWIRLHDDHGGWQIGQWAGSDWYVCGSEISMNNDDFPGSEVLEIGNKVVPAGTADRQDGVIA